jgi:hypothetical protein
MMALLVAGTVAAVGTIISPYLQQSVTVEGLVLTSNMPASVPLNSPTTVTVGIADNTLSAGALVHINIVVANWACADVAVLEAGAALACSDVGGNAVMESSAQTVAAGSLVEAWSFDVYFYDVGSTVWQVVAHT